MCVLFSFILDIKFVGRTSRGHTGFLIHLLSAVGASIFLARRIQPFLSLVDREVTFLCTNDLIVLRPLGIVASRGGYQMARGRHYAKLSLSNAARLSFSDLCILLFMFLSLCRLCLCFSLLSLELGRCSSDLFLSSRPRTGLATTCIGYG